MLSSVSAINFGSYLLVPGAQLNKQQLTTAKVSVGQSWFSPDLPIPDSSNPDLPNLEKVLSMHKCRCFVGSSINDVTV